MSGPPRIGLTQRVEVVEGRGERRDCLDQAWYAVVRDAGFLPVALPNRAELAADLLEGLDLRGVILTGGNDLADRPGARNAAPERDALERALLVACGERELPLLGVCRGMQLLVVACGGSVVPVAGHVAAPHALELRGGAGSLPLEARELVNSFHDFGVAAGDLPDDLVPLAAAPDGTLEAVAHRHRRQWGIMWHPERAPHDPRDRALVRAVFGGDAAPGGVR